MPEPHKRIKQTIIMKLNKFITLILCLIFSASIAQATPPYARASISATATVVPSLGVMHKIDYAQSLSISKSTDSQLLIQAPKNSTLLVHLSEADEDVCHAQSYLKSSITHKNSISDIYVVELSPKQTPQIVTIITIDN